MRKLSIALIGAVLLALVAEARQKPSAATGLESALRGIISKSGAEAAVAFRTLDGRSEVLIDPDKRFHAASTMKVPVMIELFRQAAAGSLSLDDPLLIRNEFRSIVDGSTYALSEGADSDKLVYAKRPYVLVVLVRGIQDQKESGALIAKLSKAVYAGVHR